MGLRTPPAPQEPLPEFEQARRKIASRSAADAEGQQNAISRRYAAMGNLNSGSYIKQQGLAADNAARTREDALSDVTAQESAAQRQINEAQQARDFAAGEAEKQRLYGTKEREGSQGFSAGQSQLQRDFQGKQFDQTFAEEKRSRGVQEGLAFDEFNRDNKALDFQKAQVLQAAGNGDAIGKYLDQIDAGAFGGSNKLATGSPASLSASPQPTIGTNAQNPALALDMQNYDKFVAIGLNTPPILKKQYFDNLSKFGINSTTIDAIKRRLNYKG